MQKGSKNSLFSVWEKKEKHMLIICLIKCLMWVFCLVYKKFLKWWWGSIGAQDTNQSAKDTKCPGWNSYFFTPSRLYTLFCWWFHHRIKMDKMSMSVRSRMTVYSILGGSVQKCTLFCEEEFAHTQKIIKIFWILKVCGLNCPF
jgi:hypothetical protein